MFLFLVPVIFLFLANDEVRLSFIASVLVFSKAGILNLVKPSSPFPLPPLQLILDIQNKTVSKDRNTNHTTTAVDPTAPPKPPQGSAALIPPLLARASGTVLDIGPGSGTQIPLLKDVTTIQTIYGAEPCIGLHNELRSRILAANLQDKYRVLHCGAQKETLIPALENAGVDVSCPAIFDTILCVRVLCSIPDPDRTIADLYDLLKPGGQLLVTEHVVNPGWRSKGSILARLAQAVYELLGWGFFMGDCHMNRDTARSLRNAAEKDGGWELVELEEHFWWSPIMYISGRLVKKA